MAQLVTSSDPLTSPLARHGAAFVCMTAVILVWTWPLALNLETHIPGALQGDGPTFIWNNWWMRRTLASPQERFFWTPLQFAPFGTSLLLHTHTAWPSFVAATIFGWLALVTASNVTLICGLVLNGLAAYLLAYALTTRWGASLVSGVVYATSPFVAAHLRGHFNLVHAWVLPLAALCAYRAFTSGRRGPALAFGATLAIGMLTDYYMTAHAAAFSALLIAALHVRVAGRAAGRMSRRAQRVFTGIAVASAALAVAIAVSGGTTIDVAGVTIIMQRSRNLVTVAWGALAVRLALAFPFRLSIVTPEGRSARRLLLYASAPLVAIAPFVVVILHAWASGEYTSQPYLWRSGPAGIDVLTMIGGNPWHPVTGSATSAMYGALGIDAIEHSAWLGVPLLLAVLLARSWWGSDLARRLAFCGAAFLAWALGPWLTIAGQQTGVLLPAFFVRWVPLLSGLRMPGRAVVAVYLALGLLVAVGLARRARPGRSAAVAAALVLIDYAAFPLPLARVPESRVYERVAGRPGNVLELPVGYRDGFGATGLFESEALLHQTIHGRAIVGGFVARLSPRLGDAYMAVPVMRSLLALSAGRAVPPRRLERDRTTAREGLSALNITTVVIHRAAATPALIAYARAVLPLVRVTGNAERDVYRVSAAE